MSNHLIGKCFKSIWNSVVKTLTMFRPLVCVIIPFFTGKKVYRIKMYKENT